MNIDWTLFARYAAPVLALFVGAVLNRFLERKPKLVSYLLHASAISVNPAEAAQPFQVNTHSIVVRNDGSRAATNVRLGHLILPDFSVFPSVTYDVTDLPGGGREIRFPTIVPHEQITVAYLYLPPTLWSHVNSYTKSDEGFARILQVLPTPPQYSRLFVGTSAVLVIIGLITVLAAVGQTFVFLVHHFSK